MKITCIQMNMLPDAPRQNFDRAEAFVKEAAMTGTDVIVLPETWNTGFSPKEGLEALADRDGAEVKKRIGGIAKAYGVNIVAGSVVNLKSGKIHNTCFVFDRKGEVIAEYDKTHLFTPMSEHKHFQMGDHLALFELDGVKCGVIICYDIRFPELIRTMALQGLDVLFVPAEWPAVRIAHLLALSKARSIENQMFTVTVNACGTNGKTVFGGCSAVFDPWGEVLAEAGPEETVIGADLDLSVLKNIRETINVFRDRRPELYQY